MFVDATLAVPERSHIPLYSVANI